MGASAFILFGLLALGALVSAFSFAVYANAGFDDWGNYAALGPVLAPLLVLVLAMIELIRDKLPLLSEGLLPLGFFGTLALLALRTWPRERGLEAAR